MQYGRLVHAPWTRALPLDAELKWALVWCLVQSARAYTVQTASQCRTISAQTLGRTTRGSSYLFRAWLCDL